jgi:glycosyltransferase involved in cell wall biosynthesis
MRVILINGREDSLRNPGGDTIQLDKTKAALESLGVETLTCGLGELDSLPACDLAHIFNIQMPETAWAAFQVLKMRGVPAVLSPIYWDLLAYWYDNAIKQRKRWRSLANRLGKPVVRWLYINWQRFKSPFNSQWRIQRRLLMQAHRVLPNSPSEVDLLAWAFALPASFRRRVDVVPNGIDTDLYQQPPKPSQAFIQRYGMRDFLLEVGMIYPVKNQLGLIEATYDIPVPLVFLGQIHPAFQEYGEACKVRGNQRGRVVFIDRLPHDELPGIYALAAVHALPSWRETPGLVSLEAAAAGCRIVSTTIGSAKDYFGEMAWYCEPDNLPSIRHAVEGALQSPASPELRKRVLAEYNWQRAGEATLAAYQRALA